MMKRSIFGNKLINVILCICMVTMIRPMPLTAYAGSDTDALAETYHISWVGHNGNSLQTDYIASTVINVPNGDEFQATMNKPCHEISSWICSVEGIKVGDLMPAQELTFTAVYTFTGHTGSGKDYTDNGNGTHDGVWSCCGMTIDDENHSINETGLCQNCQYQAETVYTTGDGLTYGTLQNAMEAKLTGAGKITLLQDVKVGASAIFGMDSTLDLNGFSISPTDDTVDALLKSVHYTAILDETGHGSIVHTGSAPAVIVTAKYLHLLSGTIQSTGGQAVQVTGDGFQISGGTVQGKTYGVEMLNGKLILRGSPVIKGHTADIYLANNASISVSMISENAYSVFTETAPTADAPVVFAEPSGSITLLPERFSSARSDTHVALNANGELEIRLGACSHASISTAGCCETCGMQFEAGYTKADNTLAYDTLQNALANVKDGGTVTLLADVSGFYTTAVNINKTMTLELNGKTVSSNNARNPIIHVGEDGDLTIQDSSAAETGLLESTAYPAVSMPKAGGKLTVLSGTVSGTAAISTAAQTTVCIRGGIIRGTSSSVTTGAIGITNGTELTVAGGTITSEKGIGIYAGRNDTVEIFGSASIKGGYYGIEAYNLVFSGVRSNVDGPIHLLLTSHNPSTGMEVKSGAVVRCSGINYNCNGVDAPVQVKVSGTLVDTRDTDYAFKDEGGSGTISITVDGGVLDATGSAVATAGRTTFTVRGSSHVRLQGDIYSNTLNVETTNYYWYCGDAAPTEGYTHSSTETAELVRYKNYFELFTGAHVSKTMLDEHNHSVSCIGSCPLAARFNESHRITDNKCSECAAEFVAAVIDGDENIAKTEYYTTLDAAVSAANASRTNKKTIMLLRNVTGNVTITGDNITLTSDSDNPKTLTGTITTQADGTTLTGITVNAGEKCGVTVAAGHDIIVGHGLNIESTKADIYLPEGSVIDLSGGIDIRYTVLVEDLPDSAGGKRLVTTGSHANRLGSADPNYYVVAENGQTYLANRLISVSVALGDIPATEDSEADTWTAEYNGGMATAGGSWIDEMGFENTLYVSWWDGNTKLNSAPTDVGTYGFKLRSEYTQDGWDSPSIAEGASNAIYEGTLTITKAAPTGYAAPTGKDLTYNAAKQNLVTAGTMSNGCQWQYSTDGVNWSTTIPEGTNAIDYTVYYRLEGGNNYNDVEFDTPIDVTIQPAELTVTVTAVGREYNGENTVTLTVSEPSGKQGSDVVTVTAEELIGTMSDANVGENKAVTLPTFTIAGEKAANYTLIQPTGVTVTIRPKTVPAPTIEVSFTSAAYTGGEIKPEVTVKDGDIVIPFSEYTVSYSNNVNAGEAKIHVVPVTDGNYTFTPMDTTFNIKPVTVTITAENKSVPVGGKIPKLTYTVNGLLGDDKLAAEPILTCEADMEKAGAYTIHIAGAEVPNTGNYEQIIKYEDGILTVVAEDANSSEAADSSGDARSSGESELKKIPDTGDDSCILWWILLLVAAQISGYVMYRKLKRSEK